MSNTREQLLHDGRGEALERLVEQEQAHVARQRAGHGQHLLLAAGEIVGSRAHTRPQRREHLQDLRLAPHHAAAAGVGGACQPAEVQVLRHRHAGEQPAALRHVADAATRHVGRREAGDVLPLEDDAAGGGGNEAGDGLEQGGFAGTVAAEQGDDLALAHVERGVVEDVALAVEGVDLGDVQEGPRLGGRGARTAGDRRRAGAGVDLLHAPVAAHGLGRTAHQHLALAHDGNHVRERQHAVDIVLHDQHGDVRRHGLYQVGNPLALGGGEARQRLVEQQHLRLARERDAEIDQALAAVGEIAGLDVLDAFEAEELDELRGLGVDVRIAVDVAPGIEPAGMARLHRQAQVLVDRQAVELAGDLERAREAPAGDAVGGEIVDRPAVEMHRAAHRAGTGRR